MRRLDACLFFLFFSSEVFAAHSQIGWYARTWTRLLAAINAADLFLAVGMLPLFFLSFFFLLSFPFPSSGVSILRPRFSDDVCAVMRESFLVAVAVFFFSSFPLFLSRMGEVIAIRRRYG